MRLTQRQWQERQCDRLPLTIKAILHDAHAARIGQPAPESTSPWYAPNQWLVGQVKRLRRSKVWKAFNEDVILTCAANGARICERIPALTDREAFCVGAGIDPPDERQKSAAGRAARMADPLWWRRQLRKHWTREAECGMRRLGIVRRGREPYASNEAVSFRAQMLARTASFFERHQLVSEDNTQLPLLAVVERSLSNPALRRGELMCRIRGFEEIARDLDHGADFYTLTAPSFFHPQLSAGGENPRYGGGSVREAQAWLVQQWAKVRAFLKKKGALLYGFRAAEPHHDATPHWHLLLFGNQHARALLRECVQRFWLSDYADEPGAAQHRVRCESIDPAKGSAVGYLAKYVAKNIDGAGSIGASNDLETGSAVLPNTIRVQTWSRIHGIRQFQQIGGPPVGLWRELRRIREGCDDADIQKAWECADRGDWRGFIRNVGGIRAGRRTNLKLRKEETGDLNKYGEPRTAQVIGVQWASAIQLTRTVQWRIDKCGTQLQHWPDSAPGAGSPGTQPTTSDSGPAGAWGGNATRRTRRTQIWTNIKATTAHERANFQTLQQLRESIRPPAAPPIEQSTDNVTNALHEAFWFRLFSDLGPVAITVAKASADRARVAALTTGPPRHG